jgi:hypothetical protein
VQHGGQRLGSRQESETWCRGLGMVKHMLGTRWLDDHEVGDTVCGLHHAEGDVERRFLGLASKPRLIVSPSLALRPVATVLVVWPQNHSLRFPILGLKTGSGSLVIWPTKSP